MGHALQNSAQQRRRRLNAFQSTFDHNEIIEVGLQRLRETFQNKKIGFELLPEKFTLNQLQLLHEIILDTSLDKRNFRKKVMKEKLVIGLDEKQKGVLHKPAQLYVLNHDEV